MDQLKVAEMVARSAHRGQTDMGGLPYWTHCHRVAMLLKGQGYDEIIQSIGWLHDVVEDTEWELPDLFDVGFSPRVLVGVQAMTQLPNEPLQAYWRRVREVEDARIVKVYGDIVDNNDPLRQRLALANGATEERIAKLRSKYAAALDFLTQFPKTPQGSWTQPTIDGMTDVTVEK